MAKTIIDNETFVRLARENAGKTYSEFVEILNRKYTNAKGSIFTVDNIGEKLKYRGLTGIMKRSNTIRVWDPETMKPLGEYLRKLVDTKGQLNVAGKSRKSPTQYAFVLNAIKNVPKNKQKELTGEQIYNALRDSKDKFVTKDGLSTYKGGQVTNLRRSSDIYAQTKDKLNLKDLYKYISGKKDSYKLGSIKQFINNANASPSIKSTSREKSILFRKALDDAGVKRFMMDGAKESSTLLFEPLSKETIETLKNNPSFYRDAEKGNRKLRFEIKNFSRNSKDYQNFGGAKDFKKMSDAQISLNKTLDNVYGKLSDAAKKTNILKFLNDNSNLRGQLELDFDSSRPVGERIFKRDLSKLTGDQLFQQMKVETDHIKSANDMQKKGITSKNFKQSDIASMSETALNKNYATNYFNGSFKNRVENFLLKNPNDVSLIEELGTKLPKGVGMNINEKIIGEKFTPVLNKQIQRLGLFELFQQGADKNLIDDLAKNETFYVDAFKKDIRKLGYENKRMVAVALGCITNKAHGGRVGLVEGGSVATCMNTKLNKDPIGSIEKISKVEDATPVLGGVKNFANTFLNVAKKGGRFGAFAAVGAAGAGLVKQFTSDDPTSYLSDENQQKNMLIDMVTEPVMEERDPGITSSAQLPVLGAVTAAGAIPGAAEYYKDRRGIRPNDKFTGPMQKGVGKIRATASPISGLLGKGLAATGTPLGMLALEPLYIGQQLAEGDSAGDIATNPLNYLGAAFAAPLTQQATKFASPAVSSFMRLGISPTMLKTVSRRFGLPGLAISAGISGYEMFNNYRQGRGLFDDG